MPPDFDDFIANLKIDESIGAVIAGFDILVSYPKMAKAICHVNLPDTIFIGTNSDAQWFVRDLLLPVNGTFLAAIEHATKKQAIVMGKPSQYLMDYTTKELALNPSRTLMIGDR